MSVKQSSFDPKVRDIATLPETAPLFTEPLYSPNSLKCKHHLKEVPPNLPGNILEKSAFNHLLEQERPNGINVGRGKERNFVMKVNLQIEKLMSRDIKWLNQVYTANQCHDQKLDLGVLTLHKET
jgi:hypothetical protein